MTRALVDSSTAATGAGCEAAKRRTLVGETCLHEELFGILGVVVLSVGDSTRQELAHCDSRALVGELQHLVGLLHRQIADDVQHQPHLAGRATNVQSGRFGAALGPGDEVLLVELWTGH